MKSKRLIVNADDFGLTDGVCAGILHCLERGAVTSTSAMVCDPGARRRLAAARDVLAGRCGVHLQLTDGRPLTGGVFPRFPSRLGELDPEALRREWRAQVGAFLECGPAPTHVDTHHHVHSIPAAFDALCEIAKEFSLPVRPLYASMTRDLRARGVACVDLSADLNAGPPLPAVARLFDTLGGGGVVELACHPALVDDELARLSVYTSPRALELEMLCAPEWPRDLAVAGIDLVSMAAVTYSP